MHQLDAVLKTMTSTVFVRFSPDNLKILHDKPLEYQMKVTAQ